MADVTTLTNPSTITAGNTEWKNIAFADPIRQSIDKSNTLLIEVTAGTFDFSLSKGRPGSGSGIPVPGNSVAAGEKIVLTTNGGDLWFKAASGTDTFRISA